MTLNHRLLLVDYLIRWPSSKKHMASEIDWLYIALPSTRTDLVTSTRQFQEKGFDFVAALSSAAQISLPQLVFDRGITTQNSGKLGVRFRERIIYLANIVHNIQQP